MVELPFIPNRVDNAPRPAAAGGEFVKHDPATGAPQALAARSGAADLEAAVASAPAAWPRGGGLTPVRRGDILFDLADILKRDREEVASTVHRETGKSMRDALGETDGAIALGRFMAGEGRRSYGRTTTSAMSNRQAMTIRQPLGVAGLIIAANTPIANVAWKVFPALACGNTAVLKAAEDTPATADVFTRKAAEAGLPPGVLNVIQGLGREAGAPLVEHPGVDVVSFTGSTAVGRSIHQAAGQRLAKIFLEMGGKNPFIVCDDADLEQALRWALLSAFSNAGQRCASASRIIVFESVYEQFRDEFVRRALALKVGSGDGDDLGPVINARQLETMLGAVASAEQAGARILCGGKRLAGPAWEGGYFLAPTVIEDADPDAGISRVELFGPITCLYRAQDFAHAMALANDCDYGLTACIHTSSVHRAQAFVAGIQAGVASVNAGTYGSEPHMPFGGLKLSGNGLREPGTEALDVYSDWKTVYLNHFPEKA